VDYKKIMQQAILQANMAAKVNEVPIGAVIVNKKGEILGEGYNRRIKDKNPLAHAEIVAIKNTAQTVGHWRFDSLTLFVTLEPCAMCAGAIIESRFKKIVFGAFNKNAGAVGSVFDLIRDPRSPRPIEVVSGILASECEFILERFFISRR
jgi:tRNA(adenine34) deaminase